MDVEEFNKLEGVVVLHCEAHIRPANIVIRENRISMVKITLHDDIRGVTIANE